MTSVNPFWDYSLTLYDHPEVQAACLYLQDEHDHDVNLLLYACWQGSRSVGLSRRELLEIQQAMADWREQLLLPTRSLRRSLAARLPGTDDRVVGARRLELLLERWQQWQLYSRVLEDGAELEPGQAMATNLQTVWQLKWDSEPVHALHVLSRRAQELLL